MGALVPFKGASSGARPPAGGILTTFDTSTSAGKLAVFRAMQAAEFQAKDLVGEKIGIVHAVAHWVTRTDDKTGEEYSGIRCVLILSDGSRVATSADAIVDGLADLSTILGREPPWNPPLPVVIRRAKSQSSGHDYLYLDVDMEGINGQ